MTGQPLYDTAICCRLTGLSRSTWWRWVHRGALPQPARKISFFTWFYQDEVDEVVKGIKKYRSLAAWWKAKGLRDDWRPYCWRQ